MVSLTDAYWRLLSHLGSTMTVSDLARDSEMEGVALRHDVDHDLGIALDMAYWEYDQGYRATYYLLHTAPYWRDGHLIDACLQLQDYGHEVGLHLNVLSEWWEGRADDPALLLGQILGDLRSAGVKIEGTSSHGDRLCYEAGFLNYWLFSELRGNAPRVDEAGLSAEGVPDPDSSFEIRYPTSESLTRSDGTQFSLWSVSMESFGIEYEAVRVDTDTYFTDSGGFWRRSPDPLDADLRRGRHQVLVHPEYWKGPQEIVFFLSTARSGSKWLASVLEEGTSATVTHEHALNHRYRNDRLVPEKRTGIGAKSFLEDRVEVRRCLAELRAWVETLGTDYYEANVYLPHVMDQLREVFPDAILVHLHRDPYDVVRSLLNREWYDTPDDPRHPAIDVMGWETLDQVERCAWYVRKTGELLRAKAHHRLSLEQITRDPRILQRSLATIGIAFHPRIASSYSQTINANKASFVGSVDEWDRQTRAHADRILVPERRELNYGRSTPWSVRLYQRLRALRPISSAGRPRVVTESRLLFEASGADLAPQVTALGCDYMRDLGGGLVIHPTGGRHANIRLGGGDWHTISSNQGWETPIGADISGIIQVDIAPKGAIARLLCLVYDHAGNLLSRRDVLYAESGNHEFNFRPRPDASKWDLALYMPNDNLPESVTVREIRLVARWRVERD